MFTNPYIFEGLISREAFWRPPRCPPWGHNVRVTLCFSPAGRANTSCLPWALKRPSRPPPFRTHGSWVGCGEKNCKCHFW